MFLPSYRVMFGADPEFFFRDKKGSVVGAEKVLPKEGLLVDYGYSKVIIDGVQAELNPRPSDCRQLLGASIKQCFLELKGLLDSNNVSIDFKQTVSLNDEEFEKLSDDSKKLGCMPSKNARSKRLEGRITIDPSTYRTRSAGGHVHIGNPYERYSDEEEDQASEIQYVLENPERLVDVLDIIVGNTCVLIDRDPGNAERRKVYGRAGEYRTPPHGVEYRTLSNFWLKDYVLMSFVMGLVRQAVNIVIADEDENLKSLVNMSEVARAINKNDFNLALRNFKKVKDFIFVETDNDREEDGFYPLMHGDEKLFTHFVKRGLDHWFSGDSVDGWITLDHMGDPGFHDFLGWVVKNDYEKSKLND